MEVYTSAEFLARTYLPIHSHRLRLEVQILGIKPCRRCDAVCDPVDHDVADELVPRELGPEPAVRHVAEGLARPRGELLDDVGAKAERRGTESHT